MSGADVPRRRRPAGPALTEGEECIARVWRELLGIEDVSPLDNFFDLGGHSLLLIRVIDRLEHEHGVRLPPGQLVYATLRQAGAILDGLVQGRAVHGSGGGPDR